MAAGLLSWRGRLFGLLIVGFVWCVVWAKKNPGMTGGKVAAAFSRCAAYSPDLSSATVVAMAAFQSSAWAAARWRW